MRRKWTIKIEIFDDYKTWKATEIEQNYGKKCEESEQ